MTALKQTYYSSLTTAIFLCLFQPFSAMAQTPSPRYLRLDEAISAALQNNPSIKIARLDQEISVSNYRQTNAVFLPQLGVSYTALTTNNPLNAFGFKLQQQSITPADFDPALLNNPGVTRDFSAQAELRQPLLNLDMYFQRQGAKAQADMYRYQEERTSQAVVFQITQAYLQVQWSYRNVAVLTESVAHARRMLQNARNFLAQGLIQKSDELNVQVHVATLESYLSKAQSAVENTSGALALLMGEPAMIFQVDTLSLTEASKIGIPGRVPENRADFLAMEKAVDASGKMLKAAQMSQLPKVNAFGTYQWNDHQAAGFGSGSYLAGVKMSWDVFSGTKNHHAIVSSKLQRQKLLEQKNLQLSQGQVELNKTFRDLIDSRYDIVQQELSVQQLAEVLRIVENRQREGLVSTNDVLVAQTQWSQQKLALAQSVYVYNVTAAYLQFITSSSKPINPLIP